MQTQTAVDWLIEFVTSKPIITIDEWNETFKQAKAIEKKQHGNTWNEAIDAHEKRGHVIARSLVDFDDYYNETYNNKK